MCNVNGNFDTIIIGGLKTLRVTRSGLAKIMVKDCMDARIEASGCKPKLVFSSNGQGIALAATDKYFRKAMDSADIIHADGMSVVFASRLLGSAQLPERIATTDFILDAAEAAEAAGLSFYFLGGTEEDNEGFVRWLKTRYPRLWIVGRHHGYFSPSEEPAVLELIREAAPDVLWVALGKPKQEFTAIRYRELLPFVGWIKTCGGMYEYYSGRGVSRAPEWMQRAGLEWLYRAANQPKRYAWRYLATNIVATWKLLTETERRKL